MLNEMAAFPSLARGDPLEPMDGMCPGFDKWKAENDCQVEKDFEAFSDLFPLPRKSRREMPSFQGYRGSGQI
jgi:hypothetical protein